MIILNKSGFVYQIGYYYEPMFSKIMEAKFYGHIEMIEYAFSLN